MNLTRYIKYVLYKILSGLGICLKCFRVFEPNRVIFSQAGHRYSGNSRFLFEYLCDSKWDVYWLDSSGLTKKGVPTNYCSKVICPDRFRSIWLLITCEKIVISHGGGDFGIFWPVLKHKKVLNVWHGTGIKNVGILERGTTEKQVRKHLKSETRYYNGVTVASDAFRYLFSSNHGVDPRKIYVTGDARTDIYIKHSAHRKGSTTQKVLYAPTFRDDVQVDIGLFFPFCADVAEIESLLERCKEFIFYLRPHPNDKRSLKQVLVLQELFPNNIVRFDSSVVPDIDMELFKFDVVVSDYSSIHFEPLIANKAIVFVPFDKEEYVLNRGMAFRYDVVTPGPKVFNTSQFIEAMLDAKNGQLEWQTKKECVRELFFNYFDTGSRERISKVLANL